MCPGLDKDIARLPLDVVIDRKETFFQKLEAIYQELNSVASQVNFLWDHHALCKHQVKALIPLELRINHNGTFDSCSNCLWCTLEKDLQIPEKVREIINTSTVPPKKAALSHHPPSGYRRRSMYRQNQRNFRKDQGILRTKADSGPDPNSPLYMIPRLPDSREDSSMVKVLQDTEILQIQTTQRTTKQFIEPTGLRIIVSMGSRDLLSEVVAKTEATSPAMSYKMKVATVILHPIGELTIDLNPRASHEPMMAKSGYFTFPAYQNTPDSKPDSTKKGAKKIKSFLMTASGKFLKGLQAAATFYPQSKQKWESECHSFEPLTSNTTALQAMDADNNASHLEKAPTQKSWHRRLQNYWKPEPASGPRTLTYVTHCNDNGISNIPPISNYHLQRQNSYRPACQPSSPPNGGLHIPEHQVRSEYRACQLYGPQRAERTDGEGQDWGSEEEDLGTPWSGLETVTEEGFFPAERTWEDSKRRRKSEEGIGEQIYGNDGDGMDCDGLEAGGELCLRHDICLREAMALGGV